MLDFLNRNRKLGHRASPLFILLKRQYGSEDLAVFLLMILFLSI